MIMRKALVLFKAELVFVDVLDMDVELMPILARDPTYTPLAFRAARGLSRAISLRKSHIKLQTFIVD